MFAGLRQRFYGMLTAAGLVWVVVGSSAPAKARPAVRASKEPATAVAIFAGGCFWCMQPPFDKLRGVVSTEVGYTGGKEPDPSYRQVARGATGHAEAVRIIYDPRRVSYERLLDVFWRSIDPTDAGGQFADRGSQYRPGIYFSSQAQRRAAERSRARLVRSRRFNKPIAVEITPAGPFYPAESYHQGYYKKNKSHYERYREGSGRGSFLRQRWGRCEGAKRTPDATVR